VSSQELVNLSEALLTSGRSGSLFLSSQGSVKKCPGSLAAIPFVILSRVCGVEKPALSEVEGISKGSPGAPKGPVPVSACSAFLSSSPARKVASVRAESPSPGSRLRYAFHAARSDDACALPCARPAFAAPGRFLGSIRLMPNA